VLAGSRPIAFLDMGWQQYGVAVEYDGDHHRKYRKQYVKDIKRLRMLEAMGWIVIRVIAEEEPEAWLGRVEAALRKRGCPLDLCGVQTLARTSAA
jgi:very-short-patch-repair endonuclease